MFVPYDLDIFLFSLFTKKNVSIINLVHTLNKIAFHVRISVKTFNNTITITFEYNFELQHKAENSNLFWIITQ